MGNEQRLARALGWFSSGLGLPQVAAPEGFARMIGASGDADSQALVRLVGVRELVVGVALLLRPRPGLLWVRVAGDAMDLALLSGMLTSKSRGQNRVTKALAAVAGVTLLDLYGSTRRRSASSSGSGQKEQAVDVKRTITINKSPEELYRFWRNFENLPRFMNHLEAVQVTGDRRSHWKAKAPAGTTVEWDAEITEDRPNEMIAWRSIEGADVDNAGSVRFVPAPGGRGTEVRVELRYDPPGGVIGAAIARLFGEEPAQQVADDLRAFKQVMETGEVVHSDASIHRWPHAAQPSNEKTRG